MSAPIAKAPWPGNVRELANAIEHAVALVQGRMIALGDLPPHLQSALAGEKVEGGGELTVFEQALQTYDEAQRRLYLEALRAGEGDVLKAARLLGTSRATLYRRLKQYGLNREISKMRYEYHF